MTEEMDKAMTCFRNAIRIDPRHYNAWYVFIFCYNILKSFEISVICILIHTLSE